MVGSGYIHKKYSRTRRYNWSSLDLYFTLFNIFVENTGEALANLVLTDVPISNRLIIMAFTSTINMFRIWSFLKKTISTIKKKDFGRLGIISFLVLTMSLCSFYGLYKRDLRLKSALALLEPQSTVFLIQILPLLILSASKMPQYINISALTPAEHYELLLVMSLLAPATYYYSYFGGTIKNELFQTSTLLLMSEYVAKLTCDNLCEYYFQNMGALPSMISHVANVCAMGIILLFDPAVFGYTKSIISMDYLIHISKLLYKTAGNSGRALVIYYMIQYLMLAASVPTADMYDLPSHLQTYLLVWDTITFSGLVTWGYHRAYAKEFTSALLKIKNRSNGSNTDSNNIILYWINAMECADYLTIAVIYTLVMIAIGPSFLKLSEFRGIILANSAEKQENNKFDVLSYLENLFFGRLG